MQHHYPEISVVIPVKNEVAKIKACLDGILSQTIPVKEIIVVDSGSTDGTLEILNQYREVTLIEIPSNEFNHGATRNLGVQHTTGEFVVLTVGDAKPCNNTWIEELLKGFVDEEVAGVCGQQVVPHDLDKNPVEWFRPLSKPGIIRYQFSNEAFEMLSPQEKKRICGWDDVTAMYRKSVLDKISFRATSFAEDAQWAKDVLIKGYAIVYNFNSRVYHYHIEDAIFTYKRTFTVLYHMHKIFGFVPDEPLNSFKEKLKIFKRLLFEEKLRLADKLKWFKYNLECKRNGSKAVKDFLLAREKGNEILESIHNQIVATPPIPVKKQLKIN